MYDTEGKIAIINIFETISLNPDTESIQNFLLRKNGIFGAEWIALSGIHNIDGIKLWCSHFENGMVFHFKLPDKELSAIESEIYFEKLFDHIIDFLTKFAGRKNYDLWVDSSVTEKIFIDKDRMLRARIGILKSIKRNNICSLKIL